MESPCQEEVLQGLSTLALWMFGVGSFGAVRDHLVYHRVWSSLVLLDAKCPSSLGSDNQKCL